MLHWEKHEILTPPSEAEIARMEPAELVELHAKYHEAIANARRDPYRYGWVLPHWRRADEVFRKYRTLLLLGANRCLAGEQEIYDPVAWCSRRVDSIDDDFHVYAWDEKNGCVVIANAIAPFAKPKERLFRLTFSNGQSLSCSARHRVLTENGWKQVCDLGLMEGIHAPCTERDGDVSYVFVRSVEDIGVGVVWDFTVPTYHTYIAGGVTSHNSGKTTYGARAVVRAVTENPGALIYCFSQNQETSVVVQQAAVYEYLPEELKAKKTEATEYISYSMQNGFAGNGFVLPNKSRILFKTYSQFQQNQSILEGMELGSRAPVGINIGAWCDEYLQGMEMLDRLYLRLATRNAKMLLTFTPKDGVTETVKYYLDDAATEESRPAELLGGRMVPYVQENAAKNTGIIYFHSKDNPWSGYSSIVEMCKAKGDDNYTLTAAYGVPTKSYSSKFPKFSRDVNVVKPSEIPTKDVTRYHIIDPAGAKNWFMCWIAVDPSDTWWVYREWPSRHEYGEWARFASGKWQTGEAAKSLGLGMRDYVDLIARLEADDGALPYERLIDPRLGQARYQGENGQSSIIEDLADHGVICVPAPGIDIEDGLQALQTKLAWNTKAPRDGINRPHLFISENCGNIIHALGEYDATPASEALKDSIDVLRYAAVDGIRYVDPKHFKPRQNFKRSY